MPQTLTFTVTNAQAVSMQRPIEVDGMAATLTFDRAVIEAEPEDAHGKTLTIVLDPGALAEFPEGSRIIATIEAAPSAPAEGV